MMYNGDYNIRIFEAGIFSLLLMFVFVSYFKLTFQTKSFLLGNPAKISTLNYTTVLFSYMVDLFIFKESLEILSLVGAGLIVFSCY